MLVRADSTYYSRDTVATITNAGARFSLTVRQDCAVRAAIAAITEDAWTRIEYPWQILDPTPGS